MMWREEPGRVVGGGPGREDPQPSPLLPRPHLGRLEGACGWSLHRQQTCPHPTCPCEPHTAATHTREGKDLTFRPSGARSGPSPPWGDSPQGRAGSLAAECIPSSSEGRRTLHKVCGVLEHARAPSHPKLLIRTERAKQVRRMRRERRLGSGKSARRFQSHHEDRGPPLPAWDPHCILALRRGHGG